MIKQFKFLLIALIGLCSFSSDEHKKPDLSYTFFRIQDKGGCYTTQNFETFLMTDNLNYELKTKVIKKKVESLTTDSTTVYSENFTLNKTDWIVIYIANYGKRTCQSGDYTTIKCLKVSKESEIEEAIQKKLKGSFVSDSYVSHTILVKDQPNNSVSEASMLDVILKQLLDFLPEGEKKEFEKNVRSTATGVRG